MSEGFKIPPEIIAKIETLFPESIERRKIAFTLMHWNKKPTTKEQETLGESVQRSRSIVYKVLTKIMNEGLFTTELGSIPFYKYNEQIRLNALKGYEINKSNDTNRTNKGEKEDPGGTDDPKVADNPPEKDGEQTELLPVTEDDSPPLAVVPPIGPALENRVSLQEAEIKELKSTMESSFTEVKDLINNLNIGVTKEDSNVNPVITQTEDAVPPKTSVTPNNKALQEMIEKSVTETLNKVQLDNPSNPEIAIADLEEIPDVILPSMDLEKENPLDTTGDSVIELDDAIISKKTVGFTPKSLMLYSLTRKKGFRGNFADFVNSCIDSALKGRNFKLTIVEDVE